MSRSLAPFVAYVVVFYLAWATLWVDGVYPWAVRRVGDTTLAYAIINIAFRLVIWVLPVFWYLYKVDHVDPIEYLQLRYHWKRGSAAGGIFSVLNLATTLYRVDASQWHGPYITWNSVLSTSILIGLFEEIPFRGFILQKLEERFAFSVAVTLSSILFVVIHIPGWLLLGMLSYFNVLFVFVFGVLMALLFRYSKSLWGPILAHSFNDFLSAVLFHKWR
jgi:uncharacterized protein